MIAIFEGPDGAGKSTLAEKLGAKGFWKLYKASSMKGLDLSQLFMAGHDEGTVDMAILSGADIVFDRSFPSAIAYDYAFDREPFSRELYDRMDARLGNADCVGFMLGPTHTIDEGYELAVQRGVDDVPKWAWEKIVQGYEKYVEWSKIEWIWLDMAAPVEENFESVMRRLA